MPRNFITLEQARERIDGKSVIIVGSAPSVLANEPGFVDSHDVVVRVNNYKLSTQTGRRTDIHYSFYGRSIRKTPKELQRDGVTLCWAKCPNSQPINCEWHVKNNNTVGIDFRYIYRSRQQFWFCDTYIPSDEQFLELFNKLDGHIASTGFSAIWDITKCAPKSIHLTGFDFFKTGIHNVDEIWKPGDPEDPIGHRPELEIKLLGELRKNNPITVGKVLEFLLP